MHDDTKERDQCLTLPDRGSFVGVIVSAGARNRFTRLLGAGKTEKARKVFSLACVVSVGIAKDIQYTCVLKLNNIGQNIGGVFGVKKIDDAIPG